MMKVATYKYQGDWDQPFDKSFNSSRTAVLLFSSLKEDELRLALEPLYEAYPGAHIVGCSTSGEIYKDEIFDHTISAMVLKFEKSSIVSAHIDADLDDDAYEIGKKLGDTLQANELRHLFVLSGGWQFDGTKLVEGIQSALPIGVTISGGVAGDDSGTMESWVLYGKNIGHGKIAALAFFGESIHIGTGCEGGWDKLGLDRIVTKAENKKIFTLDDKPALSIYKLYLGEKAKELPGSALLFPLAILDPDGNPGKIRSVMDINEEEQSLLLNDSFKEGDLVSLMSGNLKRLVDGAYNAASRASASLPKQSEESAIIAISCIGRRQMMQRRTEEELMEISEVFDDKTQMIGFYSHGEISPGLESLSSLHNQTMTITLIGEQTDA